MPSKRRDKPILIMAGGTGGHIYPALAVAVRLRELGVPLYWLGSRHGLEHRLVPPAGFRLLTISVSGLRGRGLLTVLLAPLRLLLALAQALILLRRMRPAAVLGMGGFASGPGGLAAWLLRVPLLLHEQNAILGLTNHLLAPLAVRWLEAFPGTFGRPRAEHAGNPVRAGIVQLPPPAQRRSGRSADPPHILILGGSQGARALNELLPAALGRLGAGSAQVWHQSGARHLQATRGLYAQAGVVARVDAYIDDMRAAYAWADLVICRAGAMTIAELAAAGLASILVPYPFAADDHQTANARYLSDAGAAVLIAEREIDAARLAELIAALRRDPQRLLKMAETARRLAVPEATERVARACMEVAYA